MALSTPPGKGQDFFVAVFFSFTALFSLWTLASLSRDVIKVSLASTWHVVDGVVVSSQVHPGCKNLTGYLPFVSYRYTVEQQEYVGHRMAFGAKVCSSQSEAARITKQYPEGKTVQVYFDPASPDESALNVSGAEAGTFPVFITALLILSISLPVVYHYIKRYRTSQFSDS